VPEGDTLFRTARTMHRALAGQVVTKFTTAYAHLARVDDDTPVRGRVIEKVEAAGKHLLVRFGGGLTLRSHLRMNGSWHLYRPGERWQRPAHAARIVIETAPFVAVGFDVPVAELLDDRALARQSELRALGPDLLGSSFDEAEALRRFAARASEPIAEVLLDQRAVAGAGNVYKSEVLFVAGVHPATPVSALSDDLRREVVHVARRLMQANVHDESRAEITTWRGLRRTTGRANAEERLWVYGREGKPCRRCGTRIEMAKTGAYARVTYWCPRCQPLPG
jgi:endonuclease VIII